MARAARNPPPVAIVVSRYNATVTDRLLAGALGAYERAGGDHGACRVVQAPGAFEVVTLSERAAATGRFAGVVALGCIIRGETKHDEYLAHAVTCGLVDVSIKHGIPVTNGVLTVDSAEQAMARAGGRVGDKGEEAMTALLMTLGEIDGLQERASDRRAVVDASRNGAARPDKAAGAGASRRQAKAGRRSR